MDIRQMRYFIAVVETGGFRAASQKLNITQPAISTAIAKLENSLGVRILDRLPRRVTLTGEGRVYYQHAKSILAQIDSAHDDMQALNQLKQGIIRIGASAMIAPYILPEHLLEFINKHAGIKIELRHLAGTELEQALRQGDIELGLTAREKVGQELNKEPLFRDKFVACLAKDHPLTKKKQLTWKDVFKQPMALFGPARYLREYLSAFAHDRGLELNIALQTDTLEFLIRACQQTDMISIFLESALKGDRRVTSRPIKQYSEITISAVWSKNASLSIAGKAFIDFLISRRDPVISKSLRS